MGKINKKFIFIVGPPRTGTTYLLLLLMEHKLINNTFANRYESNLFDRLGVKDAKEELLKAKGDYIVYKNPNDARNPGRILDNIENCLLIYLVRNPLEMVTSYFHLISGKGVNSCHDYSDIINHYNNMAENIIKVSNDKRVIFINSDDLFSHPEEVLKKVIINIGIKYDNSFFKNAVKKHNRGQGILYDKKKIVYRVGHYSYETFLPEIEKERIKNRCWDYYQKLLLKCI